MIEILMCTFNGGKFLIEQLDSLRCQTKPADKVSIYDDISSDNTVRIIEEYIQKYNLEEKWYLCVNQENKGWKRNFYDGILNTTGDIIFFCDQDDIWELNKIEIMSEAFKENLDIMKLNSYYTLINEKGEIVGEDNALYAPSNNTLKVKKEKFEENFGLRWKNRVGCATAISGEVREIMKDIPFSKVFSHDMTLENIISALGKSYVIDYNSIMYRIHSDNVSGKIKGTFQFEIELSEYVYNALEKHKENVDKKNMELISKYIKFNKLREKVNNGFALISWFKLIAYRDFYPKNGTKCLFGELINTLHLRCIFNKLSGNH